MNHVSSGRSNKAICLILVSQKFFSDQPPALKTILEKYSQDYKMTYIRLPQKASGLQHSNLKCIKNIFNNIKTGSSIHFVHPIEILPAWLSWQYIVQSIRRIYLRSEQSHLVFWFFHPDTYRMLMNILKIFSSPSIIFDSLDLTQNMRNIVKNNLLYYNFTHSFTGIICRTGPEPSAKIVHWRTKRLDSRILSTLNLLTPLPNN